MSFQASSFSCEKLWNAQSSIAFSKEPVKSMCNHHIFDYIPNKAIGNCIKRCPNLKSLCFTKDSPTVNIGLILSQYCPKIIHIESKFIGPILQLIDYEHLNQLECIHLNGDIYGDGEKEKMLDILLKCPKLSFYGIDCEEYLPIKFCSKIKILKIKNSDLDKLEISNLLNVQKLKISLHIYEASVISKLQNLKSITFSSDCSILP